MSTFDIRRDEPLVSVCVITYNHARYIDECLNSILEQQAEFPFEICIGEDASSDGTREICQSYADKNPDRIRLLLQERQDVIHLNGRATGKNNVLKTLKSCRGKYIAICEGDDFWIDPLKLQKQVKTLEKHPEASLCFCNVRVDYEDGTPSHPGYASAFQKMFIRKKKIGILRKPDRPLTETDLAKGNFIHTPGMMIRNWLSTEPVPPYFRSAGLGDWALNMNTARFGPMIFIDELMAVYRVHKDGFWSETRGVKVPLAIISTACAILNSGLFSAETNRILKEKVFSQLCRAWKKSKKNNTPEFVVALLTRLASDAPELMPEVIQFIWRYDRCSPARFFSRKSNR
jgi:glycosyltransferase involved in cell wall biosynthesis